MIFNLIQRPPKICDVDVTWAGDNTILLACDLLHTAFILVSYLYDNFWKSLMFTEELRTEDWFALGLEQFVQLWLAFLWSLRSYLLLNIIHGSCSLHHLVPRAQVILIFLPFYNLLHQFLWTINFPSMNGVCLNSFQHFRFFQKVLEVDNFLISEIARLS